MMKKQFFISLLLFTNLLITFSCSSNKTKKATKSKQVIEQVDDYLNSILKADEIPGMSVAIVKNGQIIHKKNYGLANIAHHVSVTDSTLFRGYSTTKLITSVAVFQLIEKGKITLKDPIYKYIEDLPESWGTIRIEHLLSCSSGLPDYKDLNKKLSDKELLKKLSQEALHFEKGDKYEYSQTNYWFLQLIIENVTNQHFEDFVKENQFKNRKNEVLFASNSLVDYPNRVSKYQYNKEYKAYEKTTYEAGNRSLAGNGLNINLNSLLDWNDKLDQNQLVTQETKHKMMSPFQYENNNFPFGYTWGIYGPEDKRYYGFTGGGVSAFMKFIDHDLTIIMLSNGFKNRPIIANAITYLSGLMDERLARKNRMLSEDIRLAFLLNDYEKAVESFTRIRRNNQNINFERALNNVGYYYLSNEQIEKSILIFKLYTEEYPKSSNAFDSLGEAYFTSKKYDLSILAYKKALELDSTNKNAKEMILKIERMTNTN